jgi:hypothetical protein
VVTRSKGERELIGQAEARDRLQIFKTFKPCVSTMSLRLSIHYAYALCFAQIPLPLVVIGIGTFVSLHETPNSPMPHNRECLKKKSINSSRNQITCLVPNRIPKHGDSHMN